MKYPSNSSSEFIGDSPATDPARRPVWSFASIIALVSVVDFVLICAAAVVGGIAYHAIAFPSYIGRIDDFLTLGASSGLLYLLLTKWIGLNQPMNLTSPVVQLRSVLVAWMWVLLLLACFLFLQRESANLSRGSTVIFAVLAPVFLVAARGYLATRIRDAAAQGRIAGRKVVLIGDAGELKALGSDVLLRNYGVQEVARFELKVAEGSRPLSRQENTTVKRAVEFARDKMIDQVVLAMRWDDVDRREAVCEHLRSLPASVTLVPDHLITPVLSHPVVQFGRVVAVQMQRAPLSRWDIVRKRALDLLIAVPLILLLTPLFLLVGLMIKLETPGPMIFRQQRKGFNGRVFTIYKFRSMQASAAKEERIRQAHRGDPRITRLGRLLRATSIDELPQLINVIRGEMSLVGPRPHAVAHETEFAHWIANYAHRHNVKPGITGWAQVNGLRGETRDLELMQKRVDLDLWYIDNWSIWLDVRILARSFTEVFGNPNAY